MFLGEGAPSGDGRGHLHLNIGPAHPAMHGIVRIFAELDGETSEVRRGDRLPPSRIREGLRGRGYNNAIPFTDRLNYVSPLINNFGYAPAVEKLLGIDVTERCKYIRAS